MGTDKRSRQRANRDQKIEDERKVSVRKKRMAIVKRYAMYAGLFGAAIVGLKLISG